MDEVVQIRRAGRVRDLPDLGAVIRLAQAGELTVQHEVLVDGRWCPAREVKELRPYLAGDPWAVWDDADSNPDHASPVRAGADGTSADTDGPVDVPISELRPVLIVGGPPAAAARAAEPSASAAPEETASGSATMNRADLDQSSGAAQRRQAQVLEVAGRERRPALNMADPGDAEVIPFPARARVEPAEIRPVGETTRVRPTYLAAWVLLGLVGLLAALVYVEAVAGWGGVARSGGDDDDVALTPPPPALASATPPTVASGRSVDADLRDRLPVDVRQISSGPEVEDGVFIMAGQLGLAVESVAVTVHSTTMRRGGPVQGVPREISVVVTWQAGEELTRERAGAALAVGRMLATQALTAREVEVVIRLPDGQVATQTFDGAKVRSYYDKQLSLEGLLGS